VGARSHGPAFGGIQTIQVLYDAAGNPIRIQVHGNIEGDVFANGITLREIERGQIFLDLVEGTENDVGLVFRVFLPGGGTVIADVGRLVFDAEGNVIFEAGPHPARHGDFPPSAPHSAKLRIVGRINRRPVCLPAVPLVCHIAGSITVSSGQPRSLPCRR
jgi:hypothetical protein